MKVRNGTYHIQRISKIGNVTPELLTESIMESSTITDGSFKYAFSDSILEKDYVFSHLTKYYPTDEVEVIDESIPDKIEKVKQNIVNHVKAECPFLFIPKKSILAHLHVWNEIQPESFARRFINLYFAKHGKYLSEIEIEPLVDLKLFIKKLQEMKSIKKIKSKVHPSNPYFSKYWDDLDKYLKTRSANELVISEESKTEVALKTRLPELVSSILENHEIDIRTLSFSEVSILMASDGYGDSQVHGIRNDRDEVIFTRHNQYTFKFEKEPDHKGLFHRVIEIISQIEKERGLNEQ